MRKFDRRDFLKASGLVALGLGVFKTRNALADNKVHQKNKTALAGKRWGLVIDSSKCTADCDDCIVACHHEHNIPSIPNELKEVKWVWKEKYENIFSNQTHEYDNKETKNKLFTVMCNHCDNPACVRVCPTKATFKRADGIVEMDYHRCIGCRYCMAGCPYGARSFNFQDPRPFIDEQNKTYPTRTQGVVEKCNFCSERLDKGLLPACVEACKKGAMVFGDLDDPNSEIRKILSEKHTIQRKPDLGTLPSIYYIP